MDDWNAEAMPAAVTDPDTRKATTEGQERFRRERLDHSAAADAHRGVPELDPGRQGAFEQKPDVQQQQIELWAYKALAAFDAHDGVVDWPQFTRVNELPEVWVNTLVRPRFEELKSRRALPAEEAPLDRREPADAGLFDSTEVQLEGQSGPAVPAVGPPPEPRPVEHRALMPQAQAGAALGKYLERVAAGEIVPDAATIERLERLAGL